MLSLIKGKEGEDPENVIIPTDMFPSVTSIKIWIIAFINTRENRRFKNKTFQAPFEKKKKRQIKS